MLDNGSWRPHAFESESHIKLVKSQFFSLLVCEQDKAASQKSSVLHALVAMKGLSRGKKTSSKQHRWSVPWNYNPRHMKTSRWMDANTYTCIHTHTHTHTHTLTHTHTPTQHQYFNKADFTLGNSHCKCSNKKNGFKHIYTF